MNQVIISGRVVRDPTVRLLNSGTSVVTFDFAVKRATVSPNRPDTDFFRCEAFGRTAEGMAKCNIKKGTYMVLSGEVRNDTFLDKTGQKVTHTLINVYRFEFGSARPDSATPGGVASETTEEDDVEVPF